MRIASNGNVLIGTTTDAGYKLDVNGTARATVLRAQKSQTSGDYTTAAIWTESYSTTTTGIAFHISGTVGKFLEMRTNGILYWDNSAVITTANVGSQSVYYSNYTGLLTITGYGVNGFTYYQTSGTFAGYTGWAGYLISNHGDGATYYNQTIIMPFWGAPKYSRKEGGTQTGVFDFWTSENLVSPVSASTLAGYLPLTGGTLSGDLTTSGWFINSTDNYGIKNSANNSSFWSQNGGWVVNSNDTALVRLAFYTQYTQQFSIGRASEGIYIINDQDAEASILCYQGAGYGGYLTGTWNVTNDLTVDGDNIVVNNSATYDTALITHKSSAVAFPNSSIWVSGMVVDAISSLYIIKFADFSIAQSQFRLYEDGKLFIYGGVFSTNSYRALTSSYVRLSGSTAPNDWFVKQSDSAGFSIVKNADTLYGISTGGTHTFSNPSNTLVTFSGSAATFSTSVSVIAG
jgi:hypothetical protein